MSGAFHRLQIALRRLPQSARAGRDDHPGRSTYCWSNRSILREDAAIRHDERLGRHLDVAIGVGVGERQPPASVEGGEFLLVATRRVRAVPGFVAEHPVHELEIEDRTTGHRCSCEYRSTAGTVLGRRRDAARRRPIAGCCTLDRARRAEGIDLERQRTPGHEPTGRHSEENADASIVAGMLREQPVLQRMQAGRFGLWPAPYRCPSLLVSCWCPAPTPRRCRTPAPSPGSRCRARTGNIPGRNRAIRSAAEACRCA